nr:hypothetical protein [Corynebacterium lactis]
MTTTKVTTAQELAAAVADGAQDIVIEGVIEGSPSITLPEGATLRGASEGAGLKFLAKGVRLTKDNTLRDITIETTDYEVAVYNDTTVDDAGVMRFDNVETVGQVYVVAEGAIKNIRVETDGLRVKAADVRGRVEQPHGYGVDVLQGGITFWNRQADKDAKFTATLKGLSAGTEETPVRGSGIFVGGYADREGHLTGGAFEADLVETGEVVIDGGIAPGTPDKITGGVFVVSGAKVKEVRNSGTVTTHGQNDMVLDNWGEVDQWIATADIRSTGPSGIGFVNFGDIRVIDIQAPIITEGKGARGFNLYDGSLDEGLFDSIKTTGDGSIGIQVSKPMNKLVVRGDVETTGGEGLSLVRGVQMTLKAIALSVKPGGVINSVEVGGALRTHGDGLTTFEVVEGGEIGTFSAGSIEALGNGSIPEAVDGKVGR